MPDHPHLEDSDWGREADIPATPDMNRLGQRYAEPRSNLGGPYELSWINPLHHRAHRRHAMCQKACLTMVVYSGYCIRP